MFKKGKGGIKAEEIPGTKADAERILLRRWPESGAKILQGARSALRVAALLRSCDALASAAAMLKEACAEASLPMVPTPIGIPMLDQVLNESIRPTFETAARAHQELVRSSGPAERQAQIAAGLTALGSLLGIEEGVWRTPYRSMALGGFSAQAWATRGKFGLEPVDYALLEVALGLENPVEGHSSYDTWRLRRGNWSKRKKTMLSDFNRGALAFFDLVLDAMETIAFREHWLRANPAQNEERYEERYDEMIDCWAFLRAKAARDFSQRTSRIPGRQLDLACEVFDRHFRFDPSTSSFRDFIRAPKPPPGSSGA